jgi:hypothetical protein
MAAETPARGHPLQLHAALDEPLSRWRWLVKWVLAVPHLIVLAALWLAFALLTLCAGVAVFFTGVYPRWIFDFNVGVLRWSWRVQVYAFTLTTDRYPPFTLAATADYPAQLDVEYPAELSRGLVLVKWWLLALPHYLIISVFGGGFTLWTQSVGGDQTTRVVIGGGLIGLLVLIAAIGLAFTGRYLRSLFDLVIGLHRWTYRVITYAALMTDEYPPFRLDTGGGEATAGATPEPPSTIAPSSA